VAYLPNSEDATARLASTILRDVKSTTSGSWEEEELRRELLPLLLDLTVALSEQVLQLRLEVAHLYRRETINKRESDQAGQEQIRTRLDAWKVKMDTLATLYQTLELLLRQAQDAGVEVLESLYGHLMRLFKQSQNFFLAGLVVRTLLTLTRGFRKRVYLSFPIYRALSSVYPSLHFLASFPRTLTSIRAPTTSTPPSPPPPPRGCPHTVLTNYFLSLFFVTAKWMTEQSAVQESNTAAPFRAYISYLLRALSLLLPHAKVAPLFMLSPLFYFLYTFF
jgi:hypothetical protein